MEALEVLPAITRLSKTVVRILGQNPGKFTLQGTNTYLVGHHNPHVLVDTGEGKDEYIPLLDEALNDITKPFEADQPDISDIIITHKHRDHVGGLSAVLTLLRERWDTRHSGAPLPFRPPRIHKIPLAEPDAKLQSTLDTLPAGLYTPVVSGDPVHDLHDGQSIQVTAMADAAAAQLRVLHTPGHTTDSLCLYYAGDRALFTGDTVLGYGSAVFDDLGTYMSSLRKMIEFGKGTTGEPLYGAVYPGHGPLVTDGLKQVTTYLQHRSDREEQILKVLKWTPPSDDLWTTWTLVSTIYADYPQSLWEPAAESVELHLRKLEAEGRVECAGGRGRGLEWEFIR